MEQIETMKNFSTGYLARTAYGTLQLNFQISIFVLFEFDDFCYDLDWSKLRRRREEVLRNDEVVEWEKKAGTFETGIRKVLHEFANLANIFQKIYVLCCINRSMALQSCMKNIFEETY